MKNGLLAILLAASLITASSSLCACSKGQDRSSAQSSLPAATRARIDQVVSEYEVIREALAEDRGDVGAPSRALADSARSAAETAPEPVRGPLEDLASAARRLAEVKSGDVGESRAAFGEVSRALISVLSSDASLQRGRHVYECPMAKGYKKWVQVSESKSNPYMGREMLQCGTETDFK
jgi:Cu(I)/Ag(I) efflux system membrane fusion protein